ncbi:Hemerythrin HHE cation binding domain-containing protein [Lentibacillus persicus]|uniref:Hemerythrin HHE cation binding domain-containing protein n=1 Tax=Lentibacillus persicus TaxID=640948 RepID=A0A1I1V3E4_9BACI|nr:hemerythrin domain-containing protein [Lentibacillus persicus]SFD77419.1 Hemerythrin HHE cation binding domain-containing protein [Lentibacillus persicus]
MSGPALKRVDSHSAIHEAALNEAIELTNMLDKLFQNNQEEEALELAYVLIEQWETRTLAHADAEEDGLYKDLVEADPNVKDDIIALTRDHDLLRIIVGDIKQELPKNGINDATIQRFQSLIIVDELHNEKEMEVLPDH